MSRLCPRPYLFTLVLLFTSIACAEESSSPWSSWSWSSTWDTSSWTYSSSEYSYSSTPYSSSEYSFSSTPYSSWTSSSWTSSSSTQTSSSTSETSSSVPYSSSAYSYSSSYYSESSPYSSESSTYVSTSSSAQSSANQTDAIEVTYNIDKVNPGGLVDVGSVIIPLERNADIYFTSIKKVGPKDAYIHSFSKTNAKLAVGYVFGGKSTTVNNVTKYRITSGASVGMFIKIIDATAIGEILDETISFKYEFIDGNTAGATQTFTYKFKIVLRNSCPWTGTTRVDSCYFQEPFEQGQPNRTFVDCRTKNLDAQELSCFKPGILDAVHLAIYNIGKADNMTLSQMVSFCLPGEDCQVRSWVSADPRHHSRVPEPFKNYPYDTIVCELEHERQKSTSNPPVSQPGGCKQCGDKVVDATYGEVCDPVLNSTADFIEDGVVKCSCKCMKKGATRIPGETDPNAADQKIKDAIEKALDKVNAALGKLATTQDETWDVYFGDHTPAVKTKVKGCLEKVRDKLSFMRADDTIVKSYPCEDAHQYSTGTVIAYVNQNDPNPGIHLAGDYNTQTTYPAWQVIVHEVTHLPNVCKTNDAAGYRDKALAAAASPNATVRAACLNNADNYALFVGGITSN